MLGCVAIIIAQEVHTYRTYTSGRCPLSRTHRALLLLRRKRIDRRDYLLAPFDDYVRSRDCHKHEAILSYTARKSFIPSSTSIFFLTMTYFFLILVIFTCFCAGYCECISLRWQLTANKLYSPCPCHGRA